ncbi:hypothetical protein [Metapseudomonas otitidis]|uniref:hypothetical protein n=1 Tax=Metapseudomonas otitidis TaxID=319939 RepID=UPI0013F60B88|nr:hypothetical protein [Pseudomonas otitidis]
MNREQIADERLQAHLYAIGSLAQIAEEDLAHEGSEPGPRLSPAGRSAINHAIFALTECAQRELDILMRGQGVKS